MKSSVFYILLLVCLISSCNNRRDGATSIEAPFGEILMADVDTLPVRQVDVTDYDLPDIIKSKELIVLTLQGKKTWYEYRKRSLGAEYLLAEQFAISCGVFIRCEVCKDTAEMIRKLASGDGDLIAFPLPEEMLTTNSVALVATGARLDSCSWACRKNSIQLKKALDAWYSDDLRQEVADMEQVIILHGGVIRMHFAPVYNRSAGQLSPYDVYFRRHASVCGWDWRLLAALCYQESMFDPNARSFAGARGLMQIMPGTAKHLGLPLSDINNPEKNIAASCRYIKELSLKYRDATTDQNRIKWVLAAYNGGANHLADAQRMALAEGMTAIWSWERMVPYVKRLQDPHYYKNNSLVKYGYMRSSETIQYVNAIMTRWTQYRKIAR